MVRKLVSYTPYMSNENYRLIIIDGETVAAEKVGLDTYKLIENPVFSCRINYGSIVLALPSENGNLVMSTIVRASDFLTRQFLTSPMLVEDKFKDTVGRKILDAGGMWETAMGGILFIHIPRHSNFDLETCLKEADLNLVEIKQ